jgi:hypothetical protein
VIWCRVLLLFAAVIDSKSDWLVLFTVKNSVA